MLVYLLGIFASAFLFLFLAAKFKNVLEIDNEDDKAAMFTISIVASFFWIASIPAVLFLLLMYKLYGFYDKLLDKY